MSDERPMPQPLNIPGTVHATKEDAFRAAGEILARAAIRIATEKAAAEARAATSGTPDAPTPDPQDTPRVAPRSKEHALRVIARLIAAEDPSTRHLTPLKAAEHAWRPGSPLVEELARMIERDRTEALRRRQEDHDRAAGRPRRHDRG